MLTLQQISDRLELEDLITAYSHAVDSRDWDALDSVFTPDAAIDYTEMGGPRGDLAAIKRFLADTMPLMSAHQHLTATSRLTVDGDSAEGRTICFNPMVLDPGPAGPGAVADGGGGAGRPHVFFCGLWYRDRFVRTPEGWRIAERYEEKAYFHNLPPGFPGEGR